ncbi:integral membrane protein MviN [Aeromicrobium marinum DSM 15272]|uniref:Integral membrane protein MviN n=1 Tax=Aeromicrobium marinum DSM 15272 TaxID=585531 RepID=E2S8P6_9ACTN|nr:murein biosynthesis integral membrane protein MurJ [Aeromicrobium marinum]EFQ84551.1 integral membrane protein MviN [Aeromicrobium marinum DSM 15272]
MSEPSDDLARASAWMALGTIVSRLTGFARMLLLVWAIGTSLDADLFDSANSLPNAMYILVAGGIFNVVLVPQLVRSMRQDEDGGDAYAQRIITLGLVVLMAATVLLLIAVPALLRLVFDGLLFTDQFTDQRESATLLMYLCLPQVFFYGAFVLVGQVLNARRRFGPMMWAPIVNNVVAAAALIAYVVAFGRGGSGSDGFTTREALLLGLGSTAGIVVQAAVLVPYLRLAGFRYRPRFDFRGVGLGHTLRLGTWTLGFIVVNQVAFVVVNRLGTGGNLEGAASGVQGSGSAVYSLGFLVSQVPHGVVTVSLATALMPTLAALAHAGRYDGMRAEIGRTLRIALVIIAPVAVAVACLGSEVGGAIAVGAASGDADIIGSTVAAFSLAMLAFCVHFVMLRGFYADEDTRTPFLLQVVIASVNVVAAVVLTQAVSPARVSTALALSYGIAYVVGTALSVTLLSRRIGRVLDAETVRFAVRLTVACVLSAAAMLGAVALAGPLGIDGDGAGAALLVVGLGGAAGAVVYLGATRLMRVQELQYLFDTVVRR